MTKGATKNKSQSSNMKKTTTKKSELTKNTEKILIENFVEFQKVMINLSEKFENLSKQMSSLLRLFEDSAKTIVKRDFFPADEKANKEIDKKLNDLLEQNKIIARGLTLIHEKNEDKKEHIEPQRHPEPQKNLESQQAISEEPEEKMNPSIMQL